MVTGESPRDVSALRNPHTALARVVRSLGTDVLALELMQFLGGVVGAEHYSLFEITRRKPREVVAASSDGTDTAHQQCSLYLSGAFWRSDALFEGAMQTLEHDGFSIQRADISLLPHDDLRKVIYAPTHVRERVLLCGGTRERAIGLSVLRSEKQGMASDAQLRELNALSPMLLALLERHMDLVSFRPDLSLALTSLDQIEGALMSADIDLPKREMQVCARILRGMTTTGIALDLEIGEETAMTYRKRAYERLKIGSQRELLVWYLSQWGAAKPIWSRPVAPAMRQLH